MPGIAVARLADGRLHLQHGPIDLLVGANGPDHAVADAERAMTERFVPLLDELVSDLAALRADVTGEAPGRTSVARRMIAAATRHAGGDFATPMIAVAGAVADEIADAGWASTTLDRLVVNNGGDIAVRQRRGSTTVGVVDDLASGHLAGRLHLAADSGIGGVATSGSPGRSLSLGIADAVTVLAATAAAADVVATLVANAVDLPGHPAIARRPATELRDDSDLGSRLVTTAVGELTDGEIERALDHGELRARRALEDDRIVAAVLCLRGRRRLVGRTSALEALGA